MAIVQEQIKKNLNQQGVINGSPKYLMFYGFFLTILIAYLTGKQTKI